MFGGGGFGGAPAPPAASAATAPVPAALADALGPPGAPYRREPPVGNAPLAADGRVTVAGCKVLAPDALHLLLFVAAGPGSGGGLSGATLTVTGLPFLAVTGARAHPPMAGQPAPAAGNGVTLPLGAVAAGTVTVVALSTVLSSLPPATAAGGTPLRMSLTYGCPATGGGPAPALAWGMDVANTDTLRPTPMDTPTFGALWQRADMKGEQAVSVPLPAGVRGLDGFMAAIPALLNLHPVQAIAATGEAIAAARVMGLPTVFCLVHMTLQAGGAVRVQVRSADRAFTAAVAPAVVAKLR